MNMIEVMDRVLEKWVMDFEVVWRSELKEFFGPFTLAKPI